ncbi:MAG: hypothetical protein JXB50_04525 [Spirochaetes bacterium]|nr:hypothetical protein [Spirochaetota bacterium]
MKKILYITIFFFIINIHIYPDTHYTDYYTGNLNVNLIIATGFGYNFSISTDLNYRDKILFIEVPINAGVDLRFSDRFSIYTGLDLLYGVSAYEKKAEDDNNKYYTHNLFIRIPAVIKLYPLIHVNEMYSNFYLGFGLFLHIWALNYYYVTTDYGYNLTGTSYFPSHKEMPPSGVYTPVNIGFRFTLGNHFPVSDRIKLGIEFFANYLFIPYINGYYNNIMYNEGAEIIMEFMPSVGVMISIGINLKE